MPPGFEPGNEGFADLLAFGAVRRNLEVIPLTVAEEVVHRAEEQIGSPYVFGAWGEFCTPANRKKRVRSDHPATFDKCQALSKGKTCETCKYRGDRMYDCRGFTHWCLFESNIVISGQTVSSQWKNDDNWAAKGTTDNMPDLVCCVFKSKDGKMPHTGLYVGGGRIIESSVEVKESVMNTAWTHWAIPKGLYTDEEIQNGRWLTVVGALKRGSTGARVTELQMMLKTLGYSVGEIDGVYGSKTQTAVSKFQKDHGLVADGIAGTVTWNLLKELSSNEEPVVTTPAKEEPVMDDVSICMFVPQAVAEKLYQDLKTTLGH